MQLSFDGTQQQSDGQSFRPLRHRVRSFEEVLKELAPFRTSPLQRTHKLHENFGLAMTGLRSEATAIQRLMRDGYGISAPIPTLPAPGLEIASLPYPEAFAELLLNYDAAIRDVARMLECNRIGRVTWASDDTVRFDYVEVSENRGILRWQRHRTRHTHELVRAVSHALDERGAPMDHRTRQLVQLMPGRWKPYGQIITGLEITQQQEHIGTDEGLTRFGEFVKGAKDTAATTAHAAGRAMVRYGLPALGIAAAGAGAVALGALALAALPVAAAVAVADPCLALGEHCLHGWE